jgi:hypothetical protein
MKYIFLVATGLFLIVASQPKTEETQALEPSTTTTVERVGENANSYLVDTTTTTILPTTTTTLSPPTTVSPPTTIVPPPPKTTTTQAPTVEAPRIIHGSVWDRLAECESGGDWSYNGASGFDGGLQFLPSTWIAYGGGQFASYAWQASRELQIVVAERVLRGQGWGAWPACSRKLGLR